MPLHHLKSLILPLAGSFALAMAPCAFAQNFDAVRLSGAASGAGQGKDGGSVGVALIAGHAYQGSDKRRNLLLPVLDYQWANGWFAGVTNGIGYNFSGSPQLQYGLRVTADMGRKESRADALRGMGDVSAAAEGGAFFNYLLPQGVALTSSARYGSGVGHKGLVVNLGAAYSTAVSARWRLSAGSGLTLANANAMQSFFGVTAAQSATSGYAAYTAGAGARDVRANLALTYVIDPRTSVTAAVSASHLLGDAKDSPLTRQRTSGTGVLVLAYAL